MTGPMEQVLCLEPQWSRPSGPNRGPRQSAQLRDQLGTEVGVVLAGVFGR